MSREAQEQARQEKELKTQGSISRHRHERKITWWNNRENLNHLKQLSDEKAILLQAENLDCSGKVALAVVCAELGDRFAKMKYYRRSCENWLEAARLYTELEAWYEAGIAYKAAADVSRNTSLHDLIFKLYLQSAVCFQRSMPLFQENPYFRQRAHGVANVLEQVLKCAIGGHHYCLIYFERCLDLAFFYYKLSEPLNMNSNRKTSYFLNKRYSSLIEQIQLPQETTLNNLILSDATTGEDNLGRKIEALAASHIQYFAPTPRFRYNPYAFPAFRPPTSNTPESDEPVTRFSR